MANSVDIPPDCTVTDSGLHPEYIDIYVNGSVVFQWGDNSPHHLIAGDLFDSGSHQGKGYEFSWAVPLELYPGGFSFPVRDAHTGYIALIKVAQDTGNG